MKIQTINADKLASLSDFLSHSVQLMDDCGLSPLAVLSDNKPVFYVLTPESWEQVSVQLREQKLGELSPAPLAVTQSLQAAPAVKQKSVENRNDQEKDRRSREELKGDRFKTP